MISEHMNTAYYYFTYKLDIDYDRQFVYNIKKIFKINLYLYI